MFHAKPSRAPPGHGCSPDGPARMTDRAPVIELDQERHRRRAALLLPAADAQPLPEPAVAPTARPGEPPAHAHPYLSPGVACEL